MGAMASGVALLVSATLRLQRSERGEDAVEYLLATGVLAVLIVSGLLLAFEFLLPLVAGGSDACNAFDPLGGNNCLSP